MTVDQEQLVYGWAAVVAEAAVLVERGFVHVNAPCCCAEEALEDAAGELAALRDTLRALPLPHSELPPPALAGLDQRAEYLKAKPA